MSLIKNISVAHKSVKYNFKRYLCFFVMLFIIQTLFASVLVLYTNNNSNQVEYLENNYDYHLQLQKLNDVQYSYIAQKSIEQSDEEEFFTIVKATRSFISGASRYRYDVYIKFDGDVSSCYETFCHKYYGPLEQDGEFGEFITPLLRYEIDYTKNTAVCAFTCIFIFLCGCIIIYIIDSIMVNHYKFVYGIYMTFGANFKKLFATSFFEMLLISIAVFIPSQIITNVVCLVILMSNQLTFKISVLSIILSFVMCIAVSAIPVFVNIKAVSRKTPLKLISAIDNSNHITSPRISSDFIGFTFPKSTEGLSLRRFRKYIVKLLISTVSFAVAFVCCAYLGSAYTQGLEVRKPQYHVIFSGYSIETDDDNEDDNGENEETNDTESQEQESGGLVSDIEDTENFEDIIGSIEDEDDESPVIYDYTYTDDIKEYLYGFNGIELIVKNCYTSAYDINSHVKLLKENAKLSGGAENEDNDRCYLNADFTVLDDEIIDIIKYYGYEVEGDLNSVLDSDDCIAITDGYNNSKKFDLSVGDKIYIATDYEYFKQPSMYMSSDLDYIMSMKLNGCSYTYKEFTVGAIIKNSPVGRSFPVYMNTSLYRQITGNTAQFTEIDIITKEGLTSDEYAELNFNLAHATDYYTNMSVTNLDTEVLSEIEANKKYESVYIFIAIMLLAVSPIIWIFSQVLFYLKRYPEFDLYFSLGASKDMIKKLFVFDGTVLAIISGIFYTLLCLVSTSLVTVYLNSELNSASEYIRFAYSLPWLPFVIGLVVTVLSAFASCYVPYVNYIRSCHPVYTGGSLDTKNEIISEGETGV